MDTLIQSDCKMYFYHFFNNNGYTIKYNEQRQYHNLPELLLLNMQYDDKYRLKYNSHWSQEGHNEVAKCFYESILKNNLIPQKYLVKNEK